MGTKILITGAAGFIGFHLSKKLIIEGYNVVGIDNLNNYYDIKLKKNRLLELDKIAHKHKKNWIFSKGNLEDKSFLEKVFLENSPNIVFNLAAQAGVRFSIENPDIYVQSNLVGFLNILECCKKFKIQNLIYSSSSSVYGGNTKIPFSEEDSVDHPISLYAATKKANELMAHTYSNLFEIPSTGIRLFTVYGPWGRPDMAPSIFTKSIFEKKPIRIFNNGNMTRDFTYISDVIEILFRLINKPAKSNKSFDKNEPNPASSWCPHQIFNIGNGSSIKLLDFINALEEEIGIQAIKLFEDMQLGDVKNTLANTKAIETWVGFKPNTNFKNGVKRFVNWYKDYYYN